jgi:hypothetical protein
VSSSAAVRSTSQRGDRVVVSDVDASLQPGAASCIAGSKGNQITLHNEGQSSGNTSARALSSVEDARSVGERNKSSHRVLPVAGEGQRGGSSSSQQLSSPQGVALESGEVTTLFGQASGSNSNLNLNSHACGVNAGADSADAAAQGATPRPVLRSMSSRARAWAMESDSETESEYEYEDEDAGPVFKYFYRVNLVASDFEHVLPGCTCMGLMKESSAGGQKRTVLVPEPSLSPSAEPATQCEVSEDYPKIGGDLQPSYSQSSKPSTLLEDSEDSHKIDDDLHQSYSQSSKPSTLLDDSEDSHKIGGDKLPEQ